MQELSSFSPAEGRALRLGIQQRYLTFNRLAKAPHAELESIFRAGHAPTLEQLDGWEFRGWNTRDITSLLGIRKFRKGFTRQSGLHQADEMIGYNVNVRQNALHAPHLALPNELEAFRHGYFLVTPYDGTGLETHTDCLLLDYHRAPLGSPLHPGRVLKDFIVQVDPQNPDLLLGKAYVQLRAISFFASFFVLERYNTIGR
jgi:hypothetical protein